MRKKRNLLRKNWSDLRAEINKVVIDKKFNPKEFKALSIHQEWKEIKKNIFQSFYEPTSYQPNFCIKNLKNDAFSVSNLKYRPEHYLDKLISEDEAVWFLINETINEEDKHWIYEGKIKNIQIVIDEIWFDELFIVSKNYKWLICIDHNDVLIAQGNKMIEKIKKLKYQNS